jgi:hypothetical protein
MHLKENGGLHVADKATRNSAFDGQGAPSSITFNRRRTHTMDLLHFMKEEYSAIRSEFPALVANDIPQGLSGKALDQFMTRVELVTRVGGELVIPELVDAGRGASAAAMLAEEQTKVIRRLVASYSKHRELPEPKIIEIFRKVGRHLDQMEKVVLPLVRELIPTAVREEIGEIALDYREDLAAVNVKPASSKLKTTISA